MFYHVPHSQMSLSLITSLSYIVNIFEHTLTDLFSAPLFHYLVFYPDEMLGFYPC